jgi:hypothetical protein
MTSRTESLGAIMKAPSESSLVGRNQDNETEASSMRRTQENGHKFLRSYSDKKMPTLNSRQEDADILEHDRQIYIPVNTTSNSIMSTATERPYNDALLGYTGHYTGKENVVGRSEIHRTGILNEDLHHDYPTYLEDQPMVYGDLEDIVMGTHPKLSPQASVIPVQTMKLIQNLQNKLKDQYPTKYKLEKKLLLVFKGRDFNDANLCSVEDFRHCMKLLNISLSEVELLSICAEYTDMLDGDTNNISYLQFISAICLKDVET